MNPFTGGGPVLVGTVIAEKKSLGWDCVLIRVQELKLYLPLLPVRFFPIHRFRVWNCIIRQGSVHLTRHVFSNHCSAESPVDIFSFLCNAPLLRFYIKNAAVAVVVVARLIIIPGPRMLHMLLTRCVCGPWLATWSFLGTAGPEGLRIFYSVPVNIEKGLFSISRVPWIAQEGSAGQGIKNQTITVRCLYMVFSIWKQTSFVFRHLANKRSLIKYSSFEDHLNWVS